MYVSYAKYVVWLDCEENAQLRMHAYTDAMRTMQQEAGPDVNRWESCSRKRGHNWFDKIPLIESPPSNEMNLSQTRNTLEWLYNAYVADICALL